VHPKLIEIGNFYLPTYGVILALAYLTGIWLLRRKAIADGLPEGKVLDLSLYILAAAILGAKLLLLVVDWRHYTANPRDLVGILRSGGVFYGGLIAATVTAVLYMRKHRLPAWRVADMGAPSIALGEAIGRWGCLAAGCCYGKACPHPWAVTFTDPFASEQVGTPLGIPLHPTQIYLSLSALAIFFVLQWAYRRRRFDGQVFWLYVLLYAVTRGVIEIWRGDRARGFVIEDVLSTSQFISLLLALLASSMLVLFSRRSREAAG
jgi:phosphatidylglycerol:prolipoprotein diacylglycerol transferase